ncbi:TetR/AcrR family transcriptional regulator [Glycomyces sp. A-F 0318]|uniref:TetR family transcriptional regulator n=1 Tax=Glycomyces amatae TaxID=2881355 RepID=UPI001E3C03BE|nr:TetR family transcriptional regulator [Glycomyces amatae]MCD0443905.1 TetR/AcrR family transcriptional regulator [Glycomyces amatae]
MPEGLRERTRRAVRAELAAIALDLFAERGFEDTTVEEIARAAGLTKRSFFRYFPAKEDAVFEGIDVTGDQVVRDLLARPADEAPWQSLRAVLSESERQIHASGQAVAGLKLIESTPSLRARVHEKRSRWRQQVSRALRDRPGADLDAFTADLLTNAATAALDTASQAWLRSDGTADRAALLDRAFDLLQPTTA